MRGVIERRILANFHVVPEAISRILPEPFRPQLVNGYAIAGICLIRLSRVRPRFFPLPIGIRSENAAHRIAVEWNENGKTRTGVYIPRRDSSSFLNSYAGGRFFPGEHHRADFEVTETEQRYSLEAKSRDGSMHLHVVGTVSDRLPNSSVFANVAEASRFFANGSLGYSATRTAGRYDGLELCCSNWNVEPLHIDRVVSTFFDDTTRFPQGTIGFDCALLMRNIQHEWHGRQDLCCTETVKELRRPALREI
ncbi:MAG: DUF2071 domain-containing protein [Planctomycetota bacterium]|jgi:hypothetical protein